MRIVRVPSSSSSSSTITSATWGCMLLLLLQRVPACSRRRKRLAPSHHSRHTKTTPTESLDLSLSLLLSRSSETMRGDWVTLVPTRCSVPLLADDQAPAWVRSLFACANGAAHAATVLCWIVDADANDDDDDDANTLHPVRPSNNIIACGSSCTHTQRNATASCVQCVVGETTLVKPSYL